MSDVIETMVLDERTGVMIVPSRDDNLSEFAAKLLKDFYLVDGETPSMGYARAARAWCGGDMALAQRLYDAVSKGWFMFASPVLSNAPLPGEKARGLAISCFAASVPDTLEGLIEHTTEVRWLSVLGGGVGGGWSDVRSVSKKAPGPIPFIHTMDADMGAYAQGATRRGSYAAYLDVSHPDIIEFINLRMPTGDSMRKCHGAGFHNAVNITDAFMRAVIAGDDWELRDPHDNALRQTVKARELWSEILEIRYRTGEPYLHFIDTANRALPETQKALGLSIKHSNLCVAPEIQVLTKKGYFQIESIAGQKVEVWNGQSWSETEIVKTGEGQKLIKVLLSDGSSIDVTPYHKFFVQEGYPNDGGIVKEVRAIDLKPKDKLAKWKMPVVYNGEDWEHAYTSGFLTADGTYFSSDRPLVWLYGQKRNLTEFLMIPGAVYRSNDGGNRDSIRYPRNILKLKYTVPVNGSLKTKLEWFAGFMDGDGTVARNGSNQQLQLCSTNYPFLEQVRLMLGTMGVQMKIAHAQQAGARMMPDGRGGLKAYECAEAWRGLITSIDVLRLTKLGFSPKRLKLLSTKPQRNARQFVQVVSVEDHGRVDDTYCFNEPKQHMGIFNGILTGNCNEIELPTNDERTFVCCLSSLNAERYDEWKHSSLVADLVTMLDNALTSFIENAPEALSKAKFSAMRERALGLGVMGFHSLLQSRMIPFESEDARTLNNELFNSVKSNALGQSYLLGGQRGEAPDMAGTGRRNSALLAVAPNASSSILLATSPSIEPNRANAYTHRTRAGSWLVKNPYLANVLETYGRNDVATWQSIIVSQGSVQHLEFLSDLERSVFKTAIELHQSWVVRHASDRQEFICQGQSVNLFFPPNCDRSYYNSIHIQAWKLGLKGLYYLRTEASAQVEAVSKKVNRVALVDHVETVEEQDNSCKACEG